MTPIKPTQATPSGDLYDIFSGGEKEMIESECTDGEAVAEQVELGPGEPKKLKLGPTCSTSAENEGSASVTERVEGEGEEVKRGNGLNGGEKVEEAGEVEMEEGGMERLDPEEKAVPPIFPEEEIEKIIQCLQSLKRSLEQAHHATV